MKFTFPLALIFLSGCAAQNAYWARPNGVSEAQFYQDLGQCEQRAVSMYPNIPPSNAGSWGPAQTSCYAYGSQVNCTTTPGIPDMNAGFQNTIAKLGNDQNRQNVIANCLRGQGYVWTTQQR